MSYIDGFVIPVPAAKKAAYREMAAKAAPLLKEYGATRVVECWGDDIRGHEPRDVGGQRGCCLATRDERASDRRDRTRVGPSTITLARPCAIGLRPADPQPLDEARSKAGVGPIGLAQQRAVGREI